MHRHHEDITKVDSTLTEQSHMIGGKPEDGEWPVWQGSFEKIALPTPTGKL
jgi:hypothetical protein